MAGFRLAPVAARARRNPWRRRRLVWSQTAVVQRTADDSWTLNDATFGGSGVAHVVHYQKTASDGFTVADAAVGANPSAGTATGGLIFLFSQGTAGSAYTRSATDGFTISDSVGGSLAPVATATYSRSCTDGFVIADAASGSLVAAGTTTTLIGLEFEFTALLDVELSFVGE